MDDNKGFTLIEALVTFLLLGIIAASLLSITRTGASSYRSVSNEVSVQYESQIVMSQVEEYLISCNAGVFWTDADHTLRVAVRDEAGNYTVHFFKWDSGAKELNYASQDVTFGGGGEALCEEPDASEWVLMGSRVTGFSAEPARTSVKIELGITMSNKSYSTESVTAMRNPAILGSASVGTDYDDWLQAACT